MSGQDLFQPRGLGPAQLCGIGASAGKAAARFRVDGRRNFPLQQLARLLLPQGRNGYRCQQGLGIGMETVPEHLLCVSKLYYSTQIHDQDAVGDMLHH